MCVSDVVMLCSTMCTDRVPANVVGLLLHTYNMHNVCECVCEISRAPHESGQSLPIVSGSFRLGVLVFLSVASYVSATMAEWRG